MAGEKKYSAKEAAIAVLAKAEEIMKKSELFKAENKEQPSNSMKPRVEEKPTERDYQNFETKPGNSSSSADDHRQEEQKSPESNPAEQKEGNNPVAGMTPGHYKLAAFCGHMHHKRKMKKGIALS